MIKSKIRKMDGSTFDELKKIIKQVLNNISIDKYKNIIKRAYIRSNKFRIKKLKKYL